MAIKVEVFSSPGCAKCGHARDVLRKLAAEIGGGCIEWRDVNVLEELDYAVRLGVLSTPAIAVDGELVFSSLPSARKLREVLETKLGRQP
jgi:predicted thioredoxin/glutaredoxin